MAISGAENGHSYVVAGHRHEAPPLQPGLYIVSTPIGNMADITLRALETLAGADRVACEDTRLTGKLLSHYGISARLAAYHDHNGARMRPRILAWLDRGDAVALVSDAGTPLVSDPGLKLVQEAASRGVDITAIPGASAVLTALSVAGLPSDQFLFAGFLPARPRAREKHLQSLAGSPATLIFYETAKRLVAMLNALFGVFGRRQAVVARELTKRHEEIVRGPLPDVIETFAQRPSIKGEVVVLVAPGDGREVWSEEAVDELLRDALDGSPTRAAAEQVARITKRSRRALYQRALELKS